MRIVIFIFILFLTVSTYRVGKYTLPQLTGTEIGTNRVKDPRFKVDSYRAERSPLFDTNKKLFEKERE